MHVSAYFCVFLGVTFVAWFVTGRMLCYLYGDLAVIYTVVVMEISSWKILLHCHL